MNQAPQKKHTLDTEQDTKTENIPFWKVMLSVIQASIGVQNSKNKERDFTQGKLVPFIAAALIFTVCFVLLIMLAVKIALS